ncbi:hypothetical protein HAX54_029355 [Datura stramonium]|uniref:Uncharacterized protein n=1 Tax=Datura stramonium TaxID=4076 RepID=A0ABS8V5T2_DATST|nr:hypothetical protein [Datura stramonium]
MAEIGASFWVAEGHGTTPNGSRVGVRQTRAQTRAQSNPQPEVVSGVQPRVASSEREQEHVVQDAPSKVRASCCTYCCLTYRCSGEIVECVRGIGA